MSEEVKPKTRDEIMLSIANAENIIVDKMHDLYSLCPVFSNEWILSVEVNYAQFLDYCECVIKKHQESKK
jgi:hypothetical protein